MPSRSFRNNNPGNIRHHNKDDIVYPVVKKWYGKDDGMNYAQFPTIADGCAALSELIATAYKNVSVGQMISKYAPSEDKNDPEKYTKVVCGWAGINPSSWIRDLPPSKFFDLCKAVSRFEGWEP